MIRLNVVILLTLIVFTSLIPELVGADIISESVSQSGLRHPGCLQSAAELNALKVSLDSGDTYHNDRWNSMIGNPRGRIDKTDWIPPRDLTVDNFPTPMKYASAGLIRYVNDWIVKGTASSETSAITILNRWATVRKFTPKAGDDLHKLHGGINLGYIAHAADMLMSSNTTWPVSEQNAFKTTLRNILLPIVNDDRPAGYNGNWDLSCTWSTMAISICLDDKALFDAQIDRLKNGITNGSVTNYLLKSGQNQESGRDQYHAQMGVYFLALSCQIAWTQGVDLYEYNNRSMGRSLEYTAAYMLGENDLPFQVYPSPVGSNSASDFATEVSSLSKSTYLSVYEMVYHHYKNYRSTELTYCKQVLENHTREEGPSANNNNYSTVCYWNLDLSQHAAQRNAAQGDVDLGINSAFNNRVYLRTNCGGDFVNTADGRSFTQEKSEWFNAGTLGYTAASIANTNEDVLYQNYRISNGSHGLDYSFDIPNGEYLVKLYFIEPTYTSVGARVMDVTIEGQLVLDDLDVYSLAGSNKALVIERSVTVGGGNLKIELNNVVDYCVVSAIEIEPLILKDFPTGQGLGYADLYRWDNITGSGINNLTSSPNFPLNHSATQQVNKLAYVKADMGNRDNYGAMIKGFIHPPVTGEYTFHVSADDTVQWWLSNDETEGNKTLIVESTSWQTSSAYKSASQTVSLVAGEKYYFEALHKEGTGGDHLTVAWSTAAYNKIDIAGDYLSPLNLTQHDINASSGANGAISPLGIVSVNDGANQVFNFTPNAGYRVNQVTVGNQTVQASSNSYTVANVTAATTINVSFEAIPTYRITASSGSNGSISPSAEEVVNEGASQVYTFVPAVGYQVDEVFVDGQVVQPSSNAYTIENITADTTIHVSFELAPQVTSLVAYYKLNETTGTTAADVSGNNYNGTISGGTNLGQTGRFGTGYVFDGSDDRVDCGKQVGSANALTVAFWMKADKLAYMIPVGKLPSGGSANGWVVKLRNDGGLWWRIGSSSSSSALKVNNVYTTNTWVHIACTFSNGVAKLYANGVKVGEQASISQGVADATVSMSLGIPSSVSTNEKFDGSLDEVYIFDEELNSTKINEVMNNTIFVVQSNTAPVIENFTVPSTAETVANINISATATDADTDPLTYAWSQVSGPGSVSFGDASVLSTAVSFDQAGTYEIKLTVSDADDSVNQTATVIVSDPVVSTYTVTYDDNGADLGTAPDDSADYASGATATVLGQSDMLEAGHAFNGWNTALDGSGITYAVGDTLAITANTTLFAQWAPYVKEYQLKSGYNYISYNGASPSDAALAFKPLIDGGQLEFVRTFDVTSGRSTYLKERYSGRQQTFYWDNGIGDLNNGQGYIVNVNVDVNLIIPVIQAQSPMVYNLKSGYNYVGYNGADIVNVQMALQPLIDNGKLEFVRTFDMTSGRSTYLKERYSGRQQTFYWDNGIGNLIDGQGYIINLNADHNGFQWVPVP